MKTRAICIIFGVFFSILLPQVGLAGFLGGPLRLTDEGSFFVAGRTIEPDFCGELSSWPNSERRSYRGPDDSITGFLRAPQPTAPMILVHGGGLTGASYESTPDGREGWAAYFVLGVGYRVYVVDALGRGP